MHFYFNCDYDIISQIISNEFSCVFCLLSRKRRSHMLHANGSHRYMHPHMNLNVIGICKLSAAHSQLNGLVFVWLSMWRCRLFANLNVLSHKLHLNGRSSECVIRCCFSPAAVKNCPLHSVQPKCRTPSCASR